MRSNRLKWVVFSLCRLGIGLLVAFVLLEATLLIFDEWIFRNALWSFDPDLGMRVRPHTLTGKSRANEFGFNDDDYPLQPRAGTFRILVLSDSFNWAGGRSWNYVDILEGRLKERFGERVEVINAGYPSTHTEEQLRLMKKFGMQYHPDLVVLGFFAGNDFSSAQPWRKRIAYGGEAIDIDTRSEGYWLLFGRPVTWQSRFFVFLRKWWRGFQLSQRGGTMPRERFLEIEHQRMLICDPRREAVYAPRVQFILDSLGQMRDLVTRDGKQFLVVAYPDEFQADPRLRDEVAEQRGVDLSGFKWDRPQVLLEAFCRREGIEYHDLLVPFQEAARAGGVLYIPSNTHWNKEGNALAAGLLQEILEPHVSAGVQRASPSTVHPFGG